MISQLLADLIYFVTKTTNHMIDPLKIVMTKNDRDIQKLLREQGVLDQVLYRFRYNSGRLLVCVLEGGNGLHTNSFLKLYENTGKHFLHV